MHYGIEAKTIYASRFSDSHRRLEYLTLEKEDWKFNDIGFNHNYDSIDYIFLLNFISYFISKICLLDKNICQEFAVITMGIYLLTSLMRDNRISFEGEVPVFDITNEPQNLIN
ncbi:hypothetical protein GYA19_00370 [Candidatus Beckwithbacteria bacterium]|nr:hypothetical protein [Candidatus Beckwithbacteria bacterium]